MIDLNKVDDISFYPVRVPPPPNTDINIWRKTLKIYTYCSSSYIFWSLYENRVVAERWFKFTCRRKIRELENEGWIIVI